MCSSHSWHTPRLLLIKLALGLPAWVLHIMCFMLLCIALPKLALCNHMWLVSPYYIGHILWHLQSSTTQTTMINPPHCHMFYQYHHNFTHICTHSPSPLRPSTCHGTCVPATPPSTNAMPNTFIFAKKMVACIYGIMANNVFRATSCVSAILFSCDSLIESLGSLQNTLQHMCNTNSPHQKGGHT